MSGTISSSITGIPRYSSVIPDDSLLQVFGDLPLKDLYCSSRVCSAWNRIANHENLPLFQGRKKDWDAGNECLRRSLTQYAGDGGSHISPQLTTLLQRIPRTLCPFADRTTIIQQLTTADDLWISAEAFRAATGYRSLFLCESLWPLVNDSCIAEQALHRAIKNGHVHLVKMLITKIPPENLKELIRINVICNTEEGASIYLEGKIGSGFDDLNCWERGLPMQKAKGSKDLWEIILLPTVCREKGYEYNPEVDHISFKFRPVLHFANGFISIPKENYEIQPRANITITPKFNH